MTTTLPDPELRMLAQALGRHKESVPDIEGAHEAVCTMVDVFGISRDPRRLAIFDQNYEVGEAAGREASKPLLGRLLDSDALDVVTTLLAYLEQVRGTDAISNFDAVDLAALDLVRSALESIEEHHTDTDTDTDTDTEDAP